jgi:hypothetical protein
VGWDGGFSSALGAVLTGKGRISVAAISFPPSISLTIVCGVSSAASENLLLPLASLPLVPSPSDGVVEGEAVVAPRRVRLLPSAARGLLLWLLALL